MAEVEVSPQVIEPQVAVGSQVVEPQIDVKPQEVEPQVAAKVEPTPKAKLKPLLSFSSLLEGELSSGEEQSVEPKPIVEVDQPLESDYADKLEQVRDSIMEYISNWRPRFVECFEAMTFSDGGISITVPTSELCEEIERSKVEFLTKVSAIAGLRGKIELNIEINETIRAVRPIRLEDRVAHINNTNPLIGELYKRLDLIVE